MNRIPRIFVAVLGVALFAGILWAAPAKSTSALASASSALQEAKQQTVTGKVTAVSEDSLTIEFKQGDDTKTMDFVIGDDTKTEGEVKAGANVRVTYRTEGDKNIAIQITVVE